MPFIKNTTERSHIKFTQLLHRVMSSNSKVGDNITTRSLRMTQSKYRTIYHHTGTSCCPFTATSASHPNILASQNQQYIRRLMCPNKRISSQKHKLGSAFPAPDSKESLKNNVRACQK